MHEERFYARSGELPFDFRQRESLRLGSQRCRDLLGLVGRSEMHVPLRDVEALRDLVQATKSVKSPKHIFVMTASIIGILVLNYYGKGHVVEPRDQRMPLGRMVARGLQHKPFTKSLILAVTNRAIGP